MVVRRFGRRGKWWLGWGGSGELFCSRTRRRSGDEKTSRFVVRDGRVEEVEIETLRTWLMRKRKVV